MKYNLILISLIYNDRKEILLIKRWRDPGKGKWSLPGGIGSLESQPDPVLAVADEVKGEFGTDYIDYDLFEMSYSDNPEPTLCLYFQGMIQGTPQTTGKETSQEFKWFTINDAINTEIAFEKKDKDVIKRFKEQILSK